MMTFAQVVETSIIVSSNSPSQDVAHLDDHNLCTVYDILSVINVTVWPGGIYEQ